MLLEPGDTEPGYTSLPVQGNLAEEVFQMTPPVGSRYNKISMSAARRQKRLPNHVPLPEIPSGSGLTLFSVQSLLPSDMIPQPYIVVKNIRDLTSLHTNVTTREYLYLINCLPLSAIYFHIYISYFMRISLKRRNIQLNIVTFGKRIGGENQ